MALRFGTAGLRAPRGPGPDALNEETVARCAHGVFAALRARRPPSEGSTGVVIGRDGRLESDRYAEVFAEVAAGVGIPVYAFDAPVPTPLVSFALRRGHFDLGVMITASHNPPVYNGFKVFGPGGAQIVPPFDAEIEAAIEAAPAASAIPRAAPRPTTLDLDAAYLTAAARVRRGDEPLGLCAAYSALHGVGSRLFRRLAARHGLELLEVDAQAEPDGRFPTVTSPNPEDASALTLALERGRAEAADLVLVHDPDADRLAVAVRHQDEQVVLTGDQIGVLLADHVLEGPGAEHAVVLSTVVSSRMIERLAAARGATSARTPTGFKWMARVAETISTPRHVRLAYEQALGFSVMDVSRDKDGLGAALAVAEAVAHQRARGRTWVDRWRELEAELGVHVGDAVTRTWPVSDPRGAIAAYQACRDAGPLRGPGLAEPALRIDYREPSVDRGDAPPFDLIVERFADGSWVGVRPSGTEPKLKVYIEAHAAPAPDARARATERAQALRAAVETRLAEIA